MNCTLWSFSVNIIYWNAAYTVAKKTRHGRRRRLNLYLQFHGVSWKRRACCNTVGTM